jgi:hypothetical protein
MMQLRSKAKPPSALGADDDFRVYRRNKREVIPIISPPAK